MSDGGIEIEGLAELEELFSDDHLTRTTRRYLASIEKKAAAPVIQAMKAAVPNTSGKGTGHMEETIGMKSRLRRSANGDQLTMKIGPGTAPYPHGKAADIIAWFLEYGANTRLGRSFKGLRSHKRKTAAQHEQDTIPAMHFLLGAWQSSKDACLATFVEAGQELVRKFKDR